MSPNAKAIEATAAMLSDASVPLPQRKAMLGQLCLDDTPMSAKVIAQLLAAAARGNAETLHAKKLEALNELLEALRGGTLRSARYIGSVSANGSAVKRVHVVLQTGDSAYPVLADEDLGRSLQTGDVVLLDVQARALLHRGPDEAGVGEEARFERRLDGARLEATLRDHDTSIFRVAAPLAAKIERGEVAPGAKLLICARTAMALDAIPAPDGLSHYRFLAREPVPEVIVSRDIGSPPRFIAELIDHVRTEMQRPDLGRKYRLRRSRTQFLCGVSGSGKTLGILAFWRLLYEVMAEVTGAPIAELPPRVFRLRLPQVLSRWLGASDKNLDRLFDEVEQLAGERFVAPDGREHRLPVLVIGEEIDGLARARGQDAIHDRIQTTALERLDLNRKRLRDRLVIFIFTSNVPGVIDPAFLRRAGGTTERFGRLGRRSFTSVLEKHLRGLPLRAVEARDGESAARSVLHRVTDWLYSPNGSDPGQVEITFVGSSTPVIKHRRDFLTGALVDRAVEQAAAAACRDEQLGVSESGLSPESLMSAFADQVRSITEVLTRENAADYVTLPDGARVGDVRRIEQPEVQPFELEMRRP